MNIKDRVDGFYETGMIKDFWLVILKISPAAILCHKNNKS